MAKAKKEVKEEVKQEVKDDRKKVIIKGRREYEVK